MKFRGCRCLELRLNGIRRLALATSWTSLYKHMGDIMDLRLSVLDVTVSYMDVMKDDLYERLLLRVELCLVKGEEEEDGEVGGDCSVRG